MGVFAALGATFGGQLRDLFLDISAPDISSTIGGG